MRKIKFRGKRVNRNGKWAYGDLRQINNSCYIFPQTPDAACDRDLVDPNTVGQFTGLIDKNGKEIYEGDIIVSEDYSKARHYVRYIDDEAMFVAMIIGSPLMEYCAIRQSWIDKYSKKIIGNIYDDPELVGEIN